MQYFYRSHCTPDAVLAFAREYFMRQGLGAAGGGDSPSFKDARGTIKVQCEIEGGHYTRVTVATADVGEAEIDRVAKRFLAELHTLDEPAHVVRGAY